MFKENQSISRLPHHDSCFFNGAGVIQVRRQQFARTFKNFSDQKKIFFLVANQQDPEEAGDESGFCCRYHGKGSIALPSESSGPEFSGIFRGIAETFIDLRQKRRGSPLWRS